jgi:hypothetical protein
MATAKSTTAELTDNIQRQMAEIRHELHQDVQEAVKGAQSLADWRSQVRRHAWLALGAAAAVGYLIVPRRRHEPAPQFVAVAPAVMGAAAMEPAPTEAKKKRSGIIGTAFGLLSPIAVRAVQNYAIQYLEQWLAAQPTGAGSGILGSSHFPGASTTGGGSTPGGRPSSPSGPGASGRPREGR